jgi:hypothetical protein
MRCWASGRSECDDLRAGNGRPIKTILDTGEGFVGHKVIDIYQRPRRLPCGRSRCLWGRFLGSTGTPSGSVPEHVADTLEGLKGGLLDCAIL